MQLCDYNGVENVDWIYIYIDKEPVSWFSLSFLLYSRSIYIEPECWFNQSPFNQFYRYALLTTIESFISNEQVKNIILQSWINFLHLSSVFEGFLNVDSCKKGQFFKMLFWKLIECENNQFLYFISYHM